MAVHSTRMLVFVRLRKNGACCGGSGFCGYGPTYCGTGCVSNCQATAECGEYAKTPGKLCPLNTCCSQYGFCGTTKDFCGTGCQSNCILNPKPLGTSSSGHILEKKVIGYYEAWMARRSCHKVQPTDLPLDALTHINFAFASIEPSTYQVVTMDSATPSSLFKDTTNVKSVKQDVSVFISIGGWTFSDNNTQTQPLFGEIAADATKRQTFADNVVHFMRQYGFDGVDLDWEYPGAGDRGGKPEDTENYVLLLKTLRETFDKSGNTYGLTFTAPSSYWYLRWFDLPNMVKYADWINVITYDLHGVWDATNPIGSIVQGHTKLTEIKTALELFWRTDIDPSKLVLGFGFYGRSFTLADPSCTSPGCPFSGGSNAGPCSDTGGMLAYYEIMSVLQGATRKRNSITPTHDKEAAVNYFTFDENQWVSYDDKVTFKQKVDWANSVGMGGALIWASDLDDDKYSAHAGLLDKEIISTSDLQAINKALSSPKSVIDDLSAFNGQKCFKYDGHCIKLDDNKAMSDACGTGFTVVGWDDAGCGKKSCHCGKPICCPSSSAPKNCIWRGDNTGTPGVSSDCSAQCKAGEMNINGIRSSWGGGFSNDGDTDKCGRGYKVFCCADPDYKEVTEGCSYADCGKDCPAGKTSVLTKWDNCWLRGQKYCCPTPAELTSCHWVGGSSGKDCANARCNATELQVDLATYGDGWDACEWGRSKAACCSVTKAPTRKATCTANLCSLIKDYCSTDSDGEYKTSKRDGAHAERHDQIIPSTREVIIIDITDSYGNPNSLVERGAADIRKIFIKGLEIVVVTAAYPSVGKLFAARRKDLILKKAFKKLKGYCASPSLGVSKLPDSPSTTEIKGLDTEHPIDKQLLRKWVEDMAKGQLASRKATSLRPIGLEFWSNVWNKGNNALARRPKVGSPKGKAPGKPNERCAEAFGSTWNPYPFLATESELNIAKGKVMMHQDPVSITDIKRLAKRAVKLDTQEAADELLTTIRMGFTVFEYLRNPDFGLRWNNVMQQMYLQLSYIEQDTSTNSLQDWWGAWTDDYFEEAEAEARTWARQALSAAMDPFVRARSSGRSLEIYDMVLQQLIAWEDEIPEMKLPVSYHMKYPNPDNGEGPSGF